MARPQKQTVDYFPHYSDASDRDTLTILQGRWGNDGYAFWFKLLEKLANTDGHFIDCRNPVKWQLLLAKTRLSEDTGTEIMKVLADIDAIDNDLWTNHKIIWSQNLVENVADAYKNRKRDLPSKPVPTDIKPVSTKRNAVTTPDKPQTKLNDTILDKNKVYGEFDNVLLSEEEYDKLIVKLGKPKTDDLIEQLSGYMRQNKANARKYTDHYATLLNWSRRDDRSGAHQQGDKGLQPGKGYTRPPKFRE